MFRSATASSLASRFFISINHPRIAPLTIPLASFTNHAPIPANGTNHLHQNGSSKDDQNRRKQRTAGPLHLIAASSFLSWFSKKSDDENTPESQLITIIKRSIIYDIMANLAMEVGDFAKAEKLFVNVMQRLFSDGFLEDHIKMLHISSKVAHLAQLQGHLDKAAQGFEWTLAKLEEKLQQGLLRQASEFCTFAWRYGKQHKHEETVQQASYCLEQIKAMEK